MMNDTEILNKGLEFAMEFGANWLQPIQSRLAEKFPALKPTELDTYDAICRSTMQRGHEFIYGSLVRASRDRRKIETKKLAEELKLFLHEQHPWVDEENLKRIFSQGIYYGWKDGLSDWLSE